MFVALHGLGDGTIDKGSCALVLLKDISLRWCHSHFDLNIFLHGERAQELFLRLVEQYADAEGVTEALKVGDPRSWVRKMNNIRNRANEVVMQEIVYA